MTNRLASETSPYLLQHADNPVDWYPWCDEAFALARESDRPVLLSIGYSACHWCHVMAHESFEDAASAELMNRLFVNIKVDREERPDVDRIYQAAHQLLTHRGGGWPLTMFLNPEDQRPFFGGTYFPKEARYGLPAFADLLERIAAYFAGRRDEIRQQGAKLSEFLDRLDSSVSSAAALDETPLGKVRQQLAQQFDQEFGGFSSAPKFPHPATIDLLLRTWRASAGEHEPDVEALFMATLTLTRMADGGIFDHVGGGFCRYSVDRYWQIPHFEKMLYDNGPLLASYAQAFLATGEGRFGRVANETADWLLSDMQASNGGFFASRDADSEGEEGKYYVWTPAEIEALLDADDYRAFAHRFGLDKEPNFEGRWHLAVREAGDDIDDVMDRARPDLQVERDRRIAPGRDEKQLCAWNALAIRGLAIAGRALQRPDLTQAAVGAADFVLQELFVDGRLRACYTDGQARFDAYLDDHAFMIDALLELLQSAWDRKYLQFAIDLADLLLAHFEDAAAGGFYFTADDHETLMHRPKPLADEAMPSGNGMAAFALQRLGHVLGVDRFIEAGERALKNAWPAMSEYPSGHVTLLAALEEYLRPPEVIVIRGGAETMHRWRDAALQLYAPHRMIFAIPENEQNLPALLAERTAEPGETIAYRCVGTHCELPVRSWESLAALL
jgi:uncharacterized protein YyaL (SSP411 family)